MKRLLGFLLLVLISSFALGQVASTRVDALNIPATGTFTWGGISLTEFGSGAGLVTCADPGIVAGVPLVADGAHGCIPSASGALNTGAFAPIYTLPAATSSTLGGVKPDGTSILNAAGAISVTPASVGAEPALGNPGTNGYVLSSTTAGTRSWIAPGSTLVGTASDLTGQTATHATVTLATTPAAGAYRVLVYMDMGTVCTTGSNSVSVVVNWTDGTSARAATVGPLTLTTAQATSAYVAGGVPIYVGSGDVTYTPTVTGTCTTGTSAYDLHASLRTP
jgi:hypothetical protein